MKFGFRLQAFGFWPVTLSRRGVMKRRDMIVMTAGAALSVAQGLGHVLLAQAMQGGPNPQRVADAERAFAATMARRDAAGFASHLADEAIFMGSGETPRVLRGKAAIVEGWRQFFDGPTPPFSWEPDIVEVLDSGGLALTSGPVHDPKGELVGRF